MSVLGAWSLTLRGSATSALLALLVCPGLAFPQIQPDGSHVELHTWVLGAEGPPVVVVHGGPGVSHRYLRPEWDRIAGYARLLYYDQRGCGRSGGESPTWRNHLDDLTRIVERHAADEKVILAASSWGSALALMFAARYPDRVSALVLSGIVPWEALRRTLPRSVALQFNPDNNDDTESVSVVRFDDPPPPTRSKSPGGFVDATHRVDETCSQTRVATYASLLDMPRLSELSAIAAPALILRGLDSAVADGTDALAAVLQDTRVLDVESGGHDPWMLFPDRVFREIEAFIRGLEQP